MSFNTKKWLLFSITIIVTILLFFLFQLFSLNKSEYFRIELPNTVTNNNSVIFYSSIEKSKEIRKNISNLFKSLSSVFYKENIFQYISTLKVNQSLFLNPVEYSFLQTIMDLPLENPNSLVFDRQENCPDTKNASLSFIGCIPFLSQLVELKKTVLNLSSEKEELTVTKKKKFQFTESDLNFIFQTYAVKYIKDYFDKENADYYVIHIGNTILVQEKDTNYGWTLQYGKKYTDLYYVYNQIIYADNNFNTPDRFIMKDIPFDKKGFPLLELWHQYYKKLYPTTENTMIKQKPDEKKRS